jgi:hypothetical protein
MLIMNYEFATAKAQGNAKKKTSLPSFLPSLPSLHSVRFDCDAKMQRQKISQKQLNINSIRHFNSNLATFKNPLLKRTLSVIRSNFAKQKGHFLIDN